MQTHREIRGSERNRENAIALEWPPSWDNYQRCENGAMGCFGLEKRELYWKNCFFVVHMTGLIRTWKVENICWALRAVGGRPCTFCALEPHKHTCKKTHDLHNPNGAHFLPGKWGQAVSTVSWLSFYTFAPTPHPWVIEAFPHQHYNTVKHKHAICTLIQPDTWSVLTHWGM